MMVFVTWILIYVKSKFIYACTQKANILTTNWNRQGQAVVCDSKRTFSDVLESLFQFSRDKVEQFLVLNIKSNTVDTKQLEQLIDEKCKIHTEATAGTDEFKEKEV